MAMATVADHAARCFKHAHIRKTYKGVAELVAVTQEDQKMEESKSQQDSQDDEDEEGEDEQSEMKD